MNQSFIFGKEAMFIPEAQKKIYWEARITDNKVEIIMRGAPLEPIILSISGKDLDIEDSWEWGAG